MSSRNQQSFGNSSGSYDPGGFEVDTPSGGKLMLKTAEEAEMYEGLRDRYIRDFSLSKQNDLIRLSVILQQAVTLERAQHQLNGMEAETDEEGHPTGRWVETEMSDADLDKAHARVIKASRQIAEIEVELGIDKRSREAGGKDTVADFVMTAKKAAHKYGVHITERTKMYEEMAMGARWQIRLLRNGDAEDRSYHNITPETIVEYVEVQLMKIEEQDKKYAREVGHLFIGKM
jgi:hypothetical protein